MNDGISPGQRAVGLSQILKIRNQRRAEVRVGTPEVHVQPLRPLLDKMTHDPLSKHAASACNDDFGHK